MSSIVFFVGAASSLCEPSQERRVPLVGHVGEPMLSRNRATFFSFCTSFPLTTCKLCPSLQEERDPADGDQSSFVRSGSEVRSLSNCHAHQDGSLQVIPVSHISFLHCFLFPRLLVFAFKIAERCPDE